MNKEKIFMLIKEWSAGPYSYGHDCPDCSRIDISTQDRIREFTSLFEQKFIVSMDLLYQCRKCGQLYQYTSWLSSPDWGECMEGITGPYEVECLYKRSSAEIISWIDSVLKSSPGSVKPVHVKPGKKIKSENGVFRCPECGSDDIDAEIKTEFTKFKCKTCGYWDMLDDWQKDEWKP